MKRIKLNIKSSSSKKLKYVIYRSQDQTDLPISLDVLKDLQPVMEVNEAACTFSDIKIHEELRRDVSVSTLDVVQYKLRNEPVKSDTCNMEIVFNYNTPTEIIQHSTAKFVVTFNSSGNITQIEITQTDKTVDVVTQNIGDYITVAGDDITLSSRYTELAYSIEISYYINAIELYDYNAGTPGVTYHGPEPSGLWEPKYSMVYKVQNVVNKAYVPFVEFKPTNDSLSDTNHEDTMYYYRIVAVDPTGKVSTPSQIIGIEYAQDVSSIKNYIEVSENYNTNQSVATWRYLTTVRAEESFVVGQLGSTAYSRFGKMVNEAVPVFDSSEMLIDTKYVTSDNKVVIKIPNVWKLENEKFNYRSFNAYRVASEMNGKYSDYSDVYTYSEKAHIPIEKLVVIKRVVTGQPLVEQVKASKITEGEIIKTFIRKNGAYYSGELESSLPLNVPHSNSPAILITESSLFDNLQIEDNAMTGEEYNYTVYLYDAYSTESAPITTIVQV